VTVFYPYLDEGEGAGSSITEGLNAASGGQKQVVHAVGCKECTLIRMGRDDWLFFAPNSTAGRLRDK
jgi:hypothetical protein